MSRHPRTMAGTIRRNCAWRSHHLWLAAPDLLHDNAPEVSAAVPRRKCVACRPRRTYRMSGRTQRYSGWGCPQGMVAQMATTRELMARGEQAPDISWRRQIWLHPPKTHSCARGCGTGVECARSFCLTTPQAKVVPVAIPWPCAGSRLAERIRRAARAAATRWAGRPQRRASQPLG